MGGLALIDLAASAREINSKCERVCVLKFVLPSDLEKKCNKITVR